MLSMKVVYLLLAMSIACEVVGTMFLSLSDGFRKPRQSIIAIVLFFICYFLFSKVIMVINMGIAYALWCGVGIISSSLFSLLYLKQPITKAGAAGIGCILAGCIVVNLFGSV